MTPPVFGETLLDLRASGIEADNIYRYKTTNVSWFPYVALQIDEGDVFQDKETAQFWLWGGEQWVGPFDTEDAACAALALLL